MTTTLRDKWIRVTRQRRCPICNRVDWCLISADGEAVICPRTPDGAVKDLGEAGHLHILRETARPRMHEYRAPVTPRTEAPNWGALMARWPSNLPCGAPESLGVSLGVSLDSLRRLQALWATDYAAIAFPMSDDLGKVIGIRLRNDQGQKWAVRGSRNGIFWPLGVGMGEPDQPILICEGPTTCAALLDLGYEVFGRPSCSTGNAILRTILSRDKRPVVIVADNDMPHLRPDGSVWHPGQEGAEKLAADLEGATRGTRIISPIGHKDARDWVRAGVTRATVDMVIQNALYWRPSRG